MSVIPPNARASRAERRERIATVILAAKIARTTGPYYTQRWHGEAIKEAESFMLELDKREAADREAENA